MRVGIESRSLFAGMLRAYYIPEDRPEELVAGSSAEWSDLLEIYAAGGLGNTILAKDRQAVKFQDSLSAHNALEELRETTVV